MPTIADTKPLPPMRRDDPSLARHLNSPTPREDGGLVPSPEHQKAIETMKRLRASGLALREISDKLKAAGMPISHMGVSKVLRAAARRAVS